MSEVPLYRGLAGTFTAEKSIKAATEKLLLQGPRRGVFLLSEVPLYRAAAEEDYT